MTGKPPHRPSGKTGAQDWERKDPKTHKHSYADVLKRKPFDGEDVRHEMHKREHDTSELHGGRRPRDNQTRVESDAPE